MTPEGTVASENVSARTASWSSSTEHSFSVTYRYHIDAAYRDIYGGALPAHPCMDAPLPVDTSEDCPHIAFTPYLRQLTERVIDGFEDPLDRARAIYDYLTQHIDYRYQPPYLLLGSIADDCAHSLRGDCGVMALTFITMCRIAGVPARWQSGLYVAPDSVGSHDWAEFYTPQTGWLNADVSFGSSARRMGRSGVAVTTLAISTRGVWWPTIDSRQSLSPLSTACARTLTITRWVRLRLTVADAVGARCSARSNSSKCSKFHFRTNR